MKYLRWLLGAVVALWALFNLWPLHAEAAYKAGLLKHLPHEMDRLIPLIAATPWWALGLWLLIVVLLLVTAWRLFRGGKAFGIYALALVLEVALWWIHTSIPAYKLAFTAAELQSDYFILGADVAVGVLIWLTERRKAAD